MPPFPYARRLTSIIKQAAPALTVWEDARVELVTVFELAHPSLPPGLGAFSPSFPVYVFGIGATKRLCKVYIAAA